jgi:hypothetical protein
MGEDGMQHLAGGGRVIGPGTAVSDSVPVAASNGEYVLNAAAVQALGPQVLDAINAIARKGGDAYAMQRAFRDQHPVLDAALNFVPIVGTAASIDDISHDLSNGDYKGAALDAVGLIPGGKLLKGAGKAVDAIDSAARRAMVSRGTGHLVDNASAAVTGAASAVGAAGTSAYAIGIADKQRAADKKRED